MGPQDLDSIQSPWMLLALILGLIVVLLIFDKLSGAKWGP